MSQKNSEQEKIVCATISEAGFVGIELEKAHLDALFERVHQMYKPEGLAQQVSIFMDKAPQYPMPGGFAHRIFHGHSLHDIKAVYDNFGLSGVLHWSQHMGADSCSPAGLPLPFAKELMSTFDLNVHEAVGAMCMNATDAIACGFGIGALGMLPDPTLKATVGLTKLWVGVAHVDSTLIVTGTIGVILGVARLLEHISQKHSVDLILKNFKEVTVDPPRGKLV